jgi:diguanylate cyclase (GGDEF)-like protein
VLAETEVPGALKWAESIRDKINELNIRPDTGAETLSITISYGIAEYNESMMRMNDLIGAADQKLYRAKESGRNRIYSENH